MPARVGRRDGFAYVPRVYVLSDFLPVRSNSFQILSSISYALDGTQILHRSRTIYLCLNLRRGI